MSICSKASHKVNIAISHSFPLVVWSQNHKLLQGNWPQSLSIKPDSASLVFCAIFKVVLSSLPMLYCLMHFIILSLSCMPTGSTSHTSDLESSAGTWIILAPSRFFTPHYLIQTIISSGQVHLLNIYTHICGTHAFSSCNTLISLVVACRLL